MKNNKIEIIPEYRALTKNDKQLIKLLAEEFKNYDHKINPEFINYHEDTHEAVIWSVKWSQKYDEHITYFNTQLHAEEQAIKYWEHLTRYEKRKTNVVVELTTVFFESYRDGSVWYFTQDSYEVITIDECLHNEKIRRGW